MHRFTASTLLLCVLLATATSAQGLAEPPQGEIVMETDIDASILPSTPALESEVRPALVTCVGGLPCGWYQANAQLTFTRDMRLGTVTAECPGNLQTTSCSCRNVANNECLQLVNSCPFQVAPPPNNRLADFCNCDYRYTCSIGRRDTRTANVAAFAFYPCLELVNSYGMGAEANVIPVIPPMQQQCDARAAAAAASNTDATRQKKK
ncbi:hypothetical protein NADE_008259 [Nannochloris sp. 'desiccata']|nr:hypothetical protein NADE_008259 [Chlorella desiccata (nom. nud.)]